MKTDARKEKIMTETASKVAAFLAKYNKWRRAEPPYDKPGAPSAITSIELGLYIDRAVELLKGWYQSDTEYGVLIQHEGKGPWDLFSLQETMEIAEKEAEANQQFCKIEYPRHPRLRKNKFRAACRKVGPWKINNRKANFGEDWRYHNLLSGNKEDKPKRNCDICETAEDAIALAGHLGAIDCGFGAYEMAEFLLAEAKGAAS